MLQKMKLCKFFDDPPSITHEAVDELLQDSLELRPRLKKPYQFLETTILKLSNYVTIIYLKQI